MKVVMLRYFNPVGAHKSGRIGEDPQVKKKKAASYLLGFGRGFIKGQAPGKLTCCEQQFCMAGLTLLAESLSYKEIQF